jgi:hypothetical protein
MGVVEWFLAAVLLACIALDYLNWLRRPTQKRRRST